MRNFSIYYVSINHQIYSSHMIHDTKTLCLSHDPTFESHITNTLQIHNMRINFMSHDTTHVFFLFHNMIQDLNVLHDKHFFCFIYVEYFFCSWTDNSTFIGHSHLCKRLKKRKNNKKLQNTMAINKVLSGVRGYGV
jgi:hypothetical protein